MRFIWDSTKAESNLRKHQVSFEIAARVFADPFAFSEQDRIENGEYRWLIVGLVERQMLVVAHALIDEDDGVEVIRIISARRAEPKERRRYEQNRSI